MEEERSRGDLHTEIPLKNYKPGQWPNPERPLEAIHLIYPSFTAYNIKLIVYI